MKEQVYSLPSAADSSLAVRTGFIRRTYLHVAGAIAAFALLEVLIFKSGLDFAITSTLLGSQYSWLIVLGLFMGVSYVADRFAHSQTSEGAQYFGLGLFVVAEADNFRPDPAHRERILFRCDFNGCLHHRVVSDRIDFNGVHLEERLSLSLVGFSRSVFSSVSVSSFAASFLALASVLFSVARWPCWLPVRYYTRRRISCTNTTLVSMSPLPWPCSPPLLCFSRMFFRS